jgi:hypothetical protein
MTLNLWKSIGMRQAVAAIVCAGVVLAWGMDGSAHSNREPSSRALEGPWLVRVTLRTCDTNVSLGSFNSLVTFHRGGTISETTSSSAFAIGQRSPGHGIWNFEGHHTFGQKMIGLINFDTAQNLPGTPGFNPTLPVTPGFFAGWSLVMHTVEFTDENHVSSSGTNEFYKADGTLYRTGCSTAVGTRFE